MFIFQSASLLDMLSTSKSISLVYIITVVFSRFKEENEQLDRNS